MKVSLVKGTTSYLARVFIQDSSSTIGAGLTGLTSGSAGLTCYRARDDDGNAAATQIILSGGTRGTWSSGGFVEKDSTNMPGVYELGIPNAALAAGSNTVLIYLRGASNMAPCVLEIELTATNNQSTGFGLVNVSSNVVQWNGSAVAVPASAGIPDINVKNIVNAAAQIDANNLLKVDAEDWKAQVIPTPNVTGVPIVDAKYLLGTIFATPATAGIPDVNVKNIVNVAAVLDANNLLKVDTEDWKGTAVAAPATAGVPEVDVKAINNVATTPVTTVKAVQGLTTADQVTTVSGNVNGSVGSVVGAVGSVTGAVGSVGAGGIAAASFAANAIDANALATSAVDEIWTEACTEPVAAPPKNPTAISALSWLHTLSRNKLTQTASAQALLADDNSTQISSATVADDGVTFTRGKVA